jgi:hypothetical protein
MDTAMTLRSAPALFATLGLALLEPAAQADTTSRTEVQLAAGACQAALPAYEGQIRKRPLALQNEGTASAFVTCALASPGYGNAEGFANLVALAVINVGGAPATLNCTLVDARNLFNDPVYLPKSIAIPTGGNASLLQWTSSENGGELFAFPAISCNLPVGVGINATLRVYAEEIGT